MATISSGSVTFTINAGEQYRVIATGEAYVDIGGGSTQSYLLINGSRERLLGGFIVATPVTIRVVSGSVDYINVSGTGDSVSLSLAQSSRTDITGVVASTESGDFVGINGKKLTLKNLGLDKNPISLLKPAGSFESNAGVLNFTLSGTYLSPVPFSAARLHFYNIGGSQIINCTAGIAASRNMNSNIFAATETPVQVTVGGSSTFTKPAALSNPASANTIWSKVVSDWIPCVSVPRDDGGLGYLLVVRTFDPSTGNSISNRCPGLGSNAISVNSYAIAAVAASGDFTFSNFNGMTGSINGLGPVVGIELLTSEGSLSIAAFGDSTINGTDSYFSGASGLTLAGVSSLSVDRTPLTWWNQGEASMNSDSYLTLFLDFYKNNYMPNLVAMCPWSPNDSDRYTQSGITRCTNIAIRFLNEARLRGSNPILVTPCPVNGITESQEGFRRQMVSIIKNLAINFNCELVDRDALYTNYSSASGGFLPGLNFNTVHPSPAGYQAESALWEKVISEYV